MIALLGDDGEFMNARGEIVVGAQRFRQWRQWADSDTVAAVRPTLPGTAAPSTANVMPVMLWPASGATVAWRSNRWPGRKRAVMGVPGSLNENNMLGGVSRVTWGAAAPGLGRARPAIKATAAVDRVE